MSQTCPISPSPNSADAIRCLPRSSSDSRSRWRSRRTPWPGSSRRSDPRPEPARSPATDLRSRTYQVAISCGCSLPLTCLGPGERPGLHASRCLGAGPPSRDTPPLSRAAGRPTPRQLKPTNRCSDQDWRQVSLQRRVSGPRRNASRLHEISARARSTGTAAVDRSMACARSRGPAAGTPQRAAGTRQARGCSSSGRAGALVVGCGFESRHPHEEPRGQQVAQRRGRFCLFGGGTGRVSSSVSRTRRS